MPYLVLSLAVAFAISPFWVPEFGGFDPDRFPVPQIDPPVQPAGYAFAIRGLIYLWLIVGAAFGAWARRDDPTWTPMRLPLAASLAVGSIWLPVAVRSPVLATILIWVMLIAALWSLWRSPSSDRWAASLPVGLYAGWLSAASCVAIGLMLGGDGWTDNMTAAWAMISVAITLAFLVQWKLARAPTYGSAAIWALVAVVVQNGLTLSGISGLALAGILLLAVATLRAARA